MKSLTFPYGVGFRSLESETRAPVPLRVEGALPPWLQGTLIRTGPSKFEVGDRTYNHWFDGLAMLHRFAFANGAVTYMSRFLEGDAFRAAKSTGKISYAEFATDPCRTLFGRIRLLHPRRIEREDLDVESGGIHFDDARVSQFLKLPANPRTTRARASQTLHELPARTRSKIWAHKVLFKGNGAHVGP